MSPAVSWQSPETGRDSPDTGHDSPDTDLDNPESGGFIGPATRRGYTFRPSTSLLSGGP